jgi:hypothetical protein
MAKSSFRQKLERLHRLLGSDNVGERENARAAINEILRKNKKTWNDLTDLLKNGSLEPWPEEPQDAGQTSRMGPVRRTINLISALGLTGAGAFFFIYLIFFAHGFWSWMLVGTGALTFVGLHWPWADFINADPRPEIRRERPSRKKPRHGHRG